MSSLQKRVVTAVCLLAFIVHFGFVIVYTLHPADDPPGPVNRIASAYVEPFFYQRWQMFVPPPKGNEALYIRTQHAATGWSPWHDLYGELVRNHQENRLRGYEAQVILYNSIFHHLPETPGLAVFSEEPQDGAFRVLKQAVRNHLPSDSSVAGFEILVVNPVSPVPSILYYQNLH